MPKVLVAGATLQCAHKGTAKLPSGDSRLQVSNKPAATAGMEVGIAFPNCTFTTPDGKPSPCSATVAATPSGISTILKIGGVGVLLDSATGATVNTPPATWSVADAGQTLLNVDH